MPDPKGLEEFADEAEQAQFAENQKIQRKLRAVTAQLGTQRAARVRAETELAALERVYEGAVSLAPEPAWLRPPKAKEGEHRAILVAFLSDLHAAEVVRADEMGGYNAYNLEIADARLRRFFDKTISLARMHNVAYDGIVLALGGDLVSGDIHEELAQTNELSVLDTTLWVAPRLLAGIERWAEEFGKVRVVSAPGNHGRDSLKPRHKGRSAHNADTHIAKMVAMFYGAANHGDAVTFDIPDSFDVSFPVYDQVFSLEHGDNLRFSGTSEIGALGPVKRGTLRKSNQHREEGHPFDVNLVGHFHQLVMSPEQGFVMNGSVKGFDEYARSWHMRPESARQALLICTPEHGVGPRVPVILTDRDAEGW